MSWWLFLDDERIPAETIESPGWRRRMGMNPIDYSLERLPWTTARSQNEAVALLKEFGWPSMVSFDHDLGHADHSGLTFARYLIELDLETATMPADFGFEVHSANPVGKANILGLLRPYMAQRLLAPRTPT